MGSEQEVQAKLETMNYDGCVLDAYWIRLYIGGLLNAVG
jgi:hypothetical protein